MSKITGLTQSLIPACDVPFDVFQNIIEATKDNEKIGGYKVGVSFLDIGLIDVVDAVKSRTQKPVIYDHQKAGTDIPDTADAFMDSMVRAGIDAVILFPQAGPATQYNWTKSAQEHGLSVIVGGEMTHPRYLSNDCGKTDDKYSRLFAQIGFNPEERGYIHFSCPNEMYALAGLMGVKDFVFPGNKPKKIEKYSNMLLPKINNFPNVWSPGLVAQGGNISDGAKAANGRFQAIVGRGIYKNKPEKRYKTLDEMKTAAEELTSQLE